MRLTVFEQGEILVGDTSNESEDRIDRRQATTLVECGEAIRARLVAWQSPNALRCGQYVGVVRSDDLLVEILPKLEGLSEPAAIRQSLLGMLSVTTGLELRSSDAVGFLASDEPFVRALARLYCRKLVECVRRGLRQEYVPHQELLPRVRGKIDWPARARLSSAQRVEFPCRFDDRSEDTVLNRALKAALLAAEAILEDSGDSSVATELRHAMSGVADSCPSRQQIAALRTDRMSWQLEPLLVLAKLILGHRSPDLGRSPSADRKTYALAWDMNVLFEEYIGRLCVQVFEPEGLRVDLQDRAYLASESLSNSPAFDLKPDVLIRRAQIPLVVADTKWKRLSMSEPNLGVIAADLYQVLTYAHRFGLDRAVLVFPHHPGLGAPGLKREFVTRPEAAPKVRVSLVTVDLSRLDAVPEQLRGGIPIGLTVSAA